MREAWRTGGREAAELAAEGAFRDEFAKVEKLHELVTAAPKSQERN